MGSIFHPCIGLGGCTVLRASGKIVEVLKGAPLAIREVEGFEVEQDVSWLDVAPDGASALIWGGWAKRLWLWRDGQGPRLIAVSDSRKDSFGGGFVKARWYWPSVSVVSYGVRLSTAEIVSS